MKKHYRHENNCLNCGTDLQGKFCHHCGQENLEIKESFGHLMNHAVSDYFHFDHQFFHTIKPLFFKPGKLTNEYMAGKRMQYLHPVKMYIFISLVFFLLLLKSSKEEHKAAEKTANTEYINHKINNELDKNHSLDSANKAKVKSDVKAALKNLKVIENKKADEDDDKDTASFHSDLSGLEGLNHKNYEQYLAAQDKLPAGQKDGWLKKLVVRKFFAYQKYGSNAKEIFLEDFKHNIPKMMFILLPLFALILKISFAGNHKYYVEHLIYAIHLHCFLFVFLSLIMISHFIIPESWNSVNGWLDFFAVCAITYYIYKSLRTIYNRTKGRTISKMIGVGFMYTLAFTVCIMGLLVITALTAA